MTHKSGNKPTIAVDIDDVLSFLAEAFVKFSNDTWGTTLSIDDWTEHWAEMWKVDYEEENRRRDVIFKSNLTDNLKHNSAAEDILRKLAKNYNLVIVTSRHRGIQKSTLQWLQDHFKGIFTEVHFAGIWDDLDKPTIEKLKKTKAEICMQIGADYLIDDQVKHCVAAAEAGITALLFGDYKWNRDIKLRPGMERVRNWTEVEKYFNEKG